MHELLLKNFALHILLTPAEQATAIELFQVKKVKKRTSLVEIGDTNRYIYFVNRGCIRMYFADKSGEEHNIMFYPENWWVCDIVSFFRKKPATNAIQTLEDTEFYCITLQQLEKLFVQVPKFERFFRILTQNGFELYERRITSHLYQSAEERYLQFRKRYPKLEQRIAQKHIASYLGITAAFLSMLRKERGL